MKSVNLIPSPRLQARWRRFRLKKWAIICGAYLLLLGSVYIASSLQLATGQSLGTTDMQTVAEQIDSYNKRIATVQGSVQSVRAKIAANRAVGSQPDWSVLLSLVGKHLGPDVVLKYCKLHLEQGGGSDLIPTGSNQDAPMNKRFVFEVRGIGRSQNAVSQFVLRLEKVGLFDKIKLLNTSREAFMEGSAIEFQLACSLGA